MNGRKWIGVIIFLFPFFLRSQPLPSNTWLARNWSIILDLGYGWESHTLFKPYRTEDVLAAIYQDDRIPDLWVAYQMKRYSQQMIELWKNNPEKLAVVNWPGIMGQVSDAKESVDENNYTSLFLINQFRFRKLWAEWYIRTSSDPEALESFTPHSREIKRLGMNSGEYDQASLSYRDKHFIFQIGRGRQVWGTDLKNNLMLSSYSASYDHIMAQFRYKRFTGIFFTGFLESIRNGDQNINRYIAGHGIQYTNQRNVVFSLAEITVYYGPDRPMDFAYLNPLIPHIEAELDKRENIADKNFSNAIWILSLDWLVAKHSRFSFTYLIDEFQFDRADRDQGRPDATGLQIRFAQSIVGSAAAFTIYSQYDRIGSYTFRHENPYTTFVSRGLPLGIPTGSDFYAVLGGFRWCLPVPVFFEFNYQHRCQGENNLLQNNYVPYEEFIEIKFPSGIQKTIKTTSITFLYSLKTNLELEIGYEYSQVSTQQVEDQEGYFLYGQLKFQIPWFQAY